jgi:hypothetical protein
MVQLVKAQVYLRLACLCDGFHREPLASKVLNATEKNHSYVTPLLTDHFQNVRFSKSEFAGTGANFDYGRFGIISVR